MSQSTPAKESRYERHLMRQRGAGVRAITTNFDFAFGFGPVSDTASIEPALKRRKTVESDASVNAPPTETTHEKGPKNEPPGHTKATRKVTKPRRRLPVEAEDASAATADAKKTTKPRRRLPIETEEVPAAANGTEDSFIATARSKKSKTKRRDHEAVQVVGAVAIAEPVSVQSKAPAKNARPRRRAAANAAQKVMEGLEEESVPIDKKRRNEEPVVRKRVRKSAKKNVVVEDIGMVELEAPVEVQQGGQQGSIESETEAVQHEAKVLAQKPRAAKYKAATTRKRRAVVAKVEDLDVEDQASEEALPSHALPTDAETDLALTEPGAEGVEHAQSRQETVKMATKRRPPATRRRAAPTRKQNDKIAETKKRDEMRGVTSSDNVEEKPSEVFEISRKREPLLEVDTNIPRRSVSPSKMDESDHSEPMLRKANALAKRKAPDPPQQPGPTRRGKLRIEHDDAQCDDMNLGSVDDKGADIALKKRSNVEASGAATKLEKIPRTKKSTKRYPVAPEADDPREHVGNTASDPTNVVAAAAAIPSKGLETNSTKRKPIAISLDSSPPPQPSKEGKEEDVDWLFAPDAVKQPSTSRSRPVAKPAHKRKSFSRLPDIDLDDLVTNIASFASSKVTPSIKAKSGTRARRK